MKRILVILGHPKTESYSGSLAQAYVNGARKGDAIIKYVKLAELKFEAIRPKKELERDLQKMQKLILWAEHIVFVYPTWWGSAPALLKGFFDRVFTPGFAFRYRKNGLGWHRLLKGRSARMIVTTGGPWLLNHIAYHNSHINAIKWATLWFAGFWPVRVTEFNGLDTHWVHEKKRKRWLAKTEKIGRSDARESVKFSWLE